jgi:hypothetical protein
MAASLTTFSSMRLSALPILLVASFATQADESNFEFTGHTKLNAVSQTYPNDSALQALFGSSSFDAQADARLNLKWRSNGWEFNADYQLLGVHGDSIGRGGNLPAELGNLVNRVPNDDRRLFNLTDVLSDSGDNALLHRLDRLWLGYSSEKTVIRFGRQALSWGNGLFYAPMDLVNPFDPATIDTEYKAGDDMLYAQYLRDSGDDVQAAAVIRRNVISSDVESDVATYAVKYHGFSGELEYDVLLAESYTNTVLGLGLGRSIGGAQWGTDLVVTDTDNDTYVQFVTNLSYSWMMKGKNMSGAIEYHYNGFGQSDSDYDPLSLADNPELLARITRGQMFTLGRHYLAGSVIIEMTPLWSITPVLLANVGDPSALLQLTSNYSLGDNMTLLGSINLPLGSSGTEFGGIETGQPRLYLSSGPSVFAQFAWYF